MPNRQSAEAPVKFNELVPLRSRTCLVYHVDKGLSIVPAETFDLLNNIGVREDGSYEGGAIMCGEGTIY